MPRPKSTPGYCLHRRSGQAYATIDGRQHWLGAHGTPESRAEYDRLVGEWLVNGRRGPQTIGAGITVSGVLAAFLAHATAYYVAPATNPDGTPKLDDAGAPVMEPSRECDNYKSAMKAVRRLYGSTPAVAFGPKALKVVRDDMVRAGLCRNVVNRRVARVKQIFKWAVSNELVPPSVHQAIATVAGLRDGKSAARESVPVRPVHEDQVNAVLPFLPPPVAAMVKLQLRTGMRSGELCVMRTCDIDTSGKTWHYRPSSHKTQHLGHERDVPLGPLAQEVLKPLLKADLRAFIFSPADALAAMRAGRLAGRKTPPKQGNSAGANRRRKPKRAPRLRYDKNSYMRAITRGCEKAFGMPADLREPVSKKEGRRHARGQGPAARGAEGLAAGARLAPAPTPAHVRHRRPSGTRPRRRPRSAGPPHGRRHAGVRGARQGAGGEDRRGDGMRYRRRGRHNSAPNATSRTRNV